MERFPRVAVVLVTWKGAADTIECLESLLKSDYPNYQVIVCDNASPDDSVAEIRRWASSSDRAVTFVEYGRAEAEEAGPVQSGGCQLTLIHTGENLGFAGGNNVALSYIKARGDAKYIWLLNNDTVVAPDALRRMVELAEGDSIIGIVGSKVLEYSNPDRVQALGGGRLITWQGRTELLGAGTTDNGEAGDTMELDYVTGASFLIRSKVIDEIGLMDPNYFLYSEEVDWCLTARQRGWRLVCASSSRVWHKGGGSVSYGSPLHDYHTVRSSLLLVRKFFPQLVFFAFIYSAYRHAAPKVFRLQGERLRAVCRAYRDFLRNGRSE